MGEINPFNFVQFLYLLSNIVSKADNFVFPEENLFVTSISREQECYGLIDLCTCTLANCYFSITMEKCLPDLDIECNDGFFEHSCSVPHAFYATGKGDLCYNTVAGPEPCRKHEYAISIEQGEGDEPGIYEIGSKRQKKSVDFCNKWSGGNFIAVRPGYYDLCLLISKCEISRKFRKILSVMVEDTVVIHEVDISRLIRKAVDDIEICFEYIITVVGDVVYLQLRGQDPFPVGTEMRPPLMKVCSGQCGSTEPEIFSYSYLLRGYNITD